MLFYNVWVQFKGCMFPKKLLVPFHFFLICHEQMAIDKVQFINIIDIMLHIQYYTMCFDLRVTMFIAFNGAGDVFAFIILD